MTATKIITALIFKTTIFKSGVFHTSWEEILIAISHMYNVIPTATMKNTILSNTHKKRTLKS